MEKQELKMICSQISELIKKTNNANVYDNIIVFLNLTSQLYDCRDEIDVIPIAQQKPNFLTRIFNRKKAKEIEDVIREQKEEKANLYKAIANAGRWEQGFNRTKKGEKVTKDNVFFGARIHGPISQPISSFEKYKNTEPTIYNAIASQMTCFMKNFEGSFDNVNWL